MAANNQHIRMSRVHPDIAVDLRLKDLFALVEANDNERTLLWRMHAHDARRSSCGLGDYIQVAWKQDLKGLIIHVGTFADMPVSLSLSFAELNGKLVAFWDATSAVVNHDMIQEWFADNIASAVEKTDANSFDIVVSALPDQAVAT